ncbi:YfhO family protein [uncultured Enterococcus sp.]|uniref:YfhO family protein n=1 Tax=uncultured Enterococcus sp. TaxID=167972 RepID=UPI002AA8F897|nr:YfhO family protein [uncultured Enterococcus sp.]
MINKMTEFIRKEGVLLFLSFIIPVGIMIVAYALIHVYPGSTRTVLASDGFSQYANFHTSFSNMLKDLNQSLFYSWYGSMGLNYWSFISYYLGGVFTPLTVFFSDVQMPDFIYYLTLLKIGCIGSSFCLYAGRTFSIPKWAQLILSVSYALSGFIIAFSEIIMWLDALIYLPLIILGINRILSVHKPTVLFMTYLLLFVSNFYMAFMVGIFSFFYAVTAIALNQKDYFKHFRMYLITSFLAGGASMIMILPMILDLTNNGESMSPIKQLKTADTGPWDLVIKNMIGVYDTTKYGSTPFIYAGLFALAFCLFFFLTKKNPSKTKNRLWQLIRGVDSQFLSGAVEFTLAGYAYTEHVFVSI